MANKHFVIVGLGSIGQRHLTNLRQLYPEAVITLVRRSGKTTLPIETLANSVVGSVSEAIAIELPTAGIIASPSPFHVSDAELFVNNRCPVFIEKPLSNNMSGVSELLELAKTNNTICMVGYILRFLPTMEKIKTIIHERKFGNVIHATVSVGQYLPNWRQDQDYKNTASAQKKLGGGALLELSHEIDYLLYLFGTPDRVHSSIQSSGCLEIDVEDQVDVAIYYDTGVVVNLHLDFLQKVASRFCIITFEQANIRWDIVAGKLIIDEVNKDTILEDVPTISNEIYIDEMNHFFKAIDGEIDLCVGLKEGSSVLQFINTLKKSAISNTATRYENELK